MDCGVMWALCASSVGKHWAMCLGVAVTAGLALVAGLPAYYSLVLSCPLM